MGRWAADVAWCASPDGDQRPIEITPTRFEGYENSCAIERLAEIAGGYEAIMLCVAEGQTARETVRMAVSGQTLQLTYLDRGGDPMRLTRCATLADTPTRAPSP